MKCKLKILCIKCSKHRANLRPTKFLSKISSTCRWRKYLKSALMQGKTQIHRRTLQKFYPSPVKWATTMLSQKNLMYQQKAHQDPTARTPSKARHLMTSNRRLFTVNNLLKSWNLHLRLMERLLLEDSSSSTGKHLIKHRHQALVQKVLPQASLILSKLSQKWAKILTIFWPIRLRASLWNKNWLTSNISKRPYKP